MPRAVIYVIFTLAETKTLKEKTKWTLRVLKVFTLGSTASLRKVIKIKNKPDKTGMMNDLTKLA